MNFAQNKFLIGYGAVLLVGGGALGFLAFKESSRYAANQESYNKELASYKQLTSAPLYPDAENLKKLEEQHEELKGAVTALNEKLIPMSFPIETVTPEQFQDILRASVSAVIKKAAENNVALPDKFYLGFDSYQTQPPSVAGAPYLLRQLKTVELVVNAMIENRVTAINTITRTPLPQEGGGAVARPAAKTTGAAKPAGAVAANVERFPFEIRFTADQSSFRVVLNRITGNSKQFLIVRNLTVTNTNEKPTPRAIPVAAAIPVQAQQGQQPQAAVDKSSPAQNLQYIVGTEKVEVNLQLEMVVFTGNSSK